MGNEDLPVSDNHAAKARAEPLLDTTLLSPTIRWSAIVLSITVGYLLLALLPLLWPGWWFADLLANLRIQLVIAAVVLALGLLLNGCWKTFLLLVLLTAYHVSWFVMPTAVSRTDATLPGTITVMAANVFTNNQNYDQIERQFRDSECDIVAVSELSFGLAKHLQDSFVTDYPHFIEFPADRGNFGIGMYSRLPLDNASIEFLTDDSIPTVIGDVQAGEKTFHIVGVHTLPPIGRQNFEHRNRHLDLIAKHVKQQKEQAADTAVIVMGDFNLTPWSPVFTTFLNDSQLNQTTAGGPFQPTWYRWPAFPFGLVLDHVLLSDQLVCVSRTIGDSVGSDHRFVTVNVGWDSMGLGK